MKPKRVSKHAIANAWLLLAVVLLIASIASFITNDPRLMYALGMVVGVQLWVLIRDIHDEYFKKDTEQDAKIVEITMRLLDETPDDETLQEMVNTLNAELKKRGINKN